MRTHLGNMRLHPVQEKSLIEQADIEVAILTDLFSCQKAKETNSVVEIDEDDVVPRCFEKFGAVPIGICIYRIACIPPSDIIIIC